MDILLEIHAPGINLHSNRWSLHKMFLEEIEIICERVAAEAWKNYEREGRGTLMIAQKQWMNVIRQDWTAETFPACYHPVAMTLEEMGLDTLRGGLREMIDEYDATREAVLSVHHHPGDMISAYLFKSDPTPPDCYRRVFA